MFVPLAETAPTVDPSTSGGVFSLLWVIIALSALFLLLITGVGSLIHIYSVGYMAHDVRRARFFAYLNLFVASMLTLVLADNYLVVFLGWEGVGMALGTMLTFATFGTLTFAGVSAAADRASDTTLTVLGLLFLLAACGKSAQ